MALSLHTFHQIMVKRLTIRTNIKRGKKNSDHIHPQIDLHMEIERANHREVGKGVQKTH